MFLVEFLYKSLRPPKVVSVIITIFPYAMVYWLFKREMEIPDTMSVKEVDSLTRRLEMKVFKATGIILAAVGGYSYNTEDSVAARVRVDVMKLVLAHEWALQLHGFYLDETAKIMRFDVVMSFDIPHKEGVRILQEEMRAAYPQYDIQFVPDVDLSD